MPPVVTDVYAPKKRLNIVEVLPPIWRVLLRFRKRLGLSSRIGFGDWSERSLTRSISILRSDQNSHRTPT